MHEPVEVGLHIDAPPLTCKFNHSVLRIVIGIGHVRTGTHMIEHSSPKNTIPANILRLCFEIAKARRDENTGNGLDEPSM